MSTLSVRPINTGIMAVPKSVLFHTSLLDIYHTADVQEGTPVFCFLVEGGDRPLLVDTGMSSTEWAHKYHGAASFQPTGMSVIEQLNTLGYKPADIGHVVLTHLHWDHCHYMEHFTNARFYVHPSELAFAENPLPLYYKAYEHSILGIQSPFSKVTLAPVTEGMEIMPGVSILETPGHSPGHIAVIVNTASGDYLCAGDAVATLDNFKPVEELHYSVSPIGLSINLIEAWNSLEKMKLRAGSPDRVLASHDVALLERIAKEPVFR